MEVYMITREDILNLAEKEQDACVSIYMPTHKMGVEVQQDPIRLKNLLAEAKKQLKEWEVKEQKIDAMLEEPKKLLDNSLFWQHNDQGLAIFISEDDFDYYRIPHEFKERIMVNDHYLITPLIPMITKEGTFCVLALSQKNVRLLRCTRGRFEEVELEESPTNMEEFQKFDEYEKSMSVPSSTRGRESMFHGWGDAAIEHPAVENYLKHIENEVTKKLRTWRDPLILAGVEEALAVYRDVNHYSRLMDDTITENPDPKSNEKIKNEAWEIIQSYFLQDMYEDMERYGDLIGSDKQSDNLTEIVEAAFYGKIDSLFVPIGEHSWGWFDEERDVVHHSKGPETRNHDLINMAAIKTLTQSGDVYALNKDEMPNNSSIAAIFRYG